MKLIDAHSIFADYISYQDVTRREVFFKEWIADRPDFTSEVTSSGEVFSLKLLGDYYVTWTRDSNALTIGNKTDEVVIKYTDDMVGPMETSYILRNFDTWKFDCIFDLLLGIKHDDLEQRERALKSKLLGYNTFYHVVLSPHIVGPNQKMLSFEFLDDIIVADSLTLIAEGIGSNEPRIVGWYEPKRYMLGQKKSISNPQYEYRSCTTTQGLERLLRAFYDANFQKIKVFDPRQKPEKE